MDQEKEEEEELRSIRNEGHLDMDVDPYGHHANTCHVHTTITPSCGHHCKKKVNLFIELDFFFRKKKLNSETVGSSEN